MWWSIRKKLIFFLIAATVIPFGLANALTYYHTTEALTRKFVATGHVVIENGKADIASYLSDFSYIPTSLYFYRPLMNVFRDGVSSNMTNNQEEINRILGYLYNSRPEIEQMHLYIHNGKDSYTNYHSTLSARGYYENVLEHPYYRELSERSDFTIIEPTHEIYSYNNLSIIPNSQKNPVLSFHNVIRDIPSDRVLAFLSLDIELSRVKTILDRLYDPATEDFYLINEKGVVVYSSDEALIGTTNHQDWFTELKKGPEESQSLEWKDRDFSGVIVYDQFSEPHKDWYIVKRIPYHVLYQSARETALMNILIGMVSLVFVAFATMWVSYKFTAPINVLIANMKNVEKGEFRADFDSLGNDEFGLLGRHFKMMIAKINHLIEREYKLEIEKKSTQLSVLQSQINPHFLYNALQSIGTLALKHQAAPVYSLLTSLAKMMRYSINMQEDYVTLASEVQHAKAYLSLQKQRFDDRFDYDLRIEPEAEAIQVPKMILQPIVENCFKHGFDQWEGKAFIGIEACKRKDRLCITIKDNGIGIAQEEAARIQEGLFNDIAPKEGSVGLKNIYDRLQIYYPHEARMLIRTSEGKGFEVTMEFPLIPPRRLET